MDEHTRKNWMVYFLAMSIIMILILHLDDAQHDMLYMMLGQMTAIMS